MLTRALSWTAEEPGCKVTVANQTDAELVRACLDGRREAFDVIVERHQRHVYQLCYRFAGNHEDANDLTQDVFIRAYRGLKTFKGQASLGTWLYRIAVNVSLTKVGAKGRTASLDPLLEANDHRLLPVRVFVGSAIGVRHLEILERRARPCQARLSRDVLLVHERGEAAPRGSLWYRAAPS